MTAWTLTAKTPPVALVPGMILRLEAISPTTGQAVSGVIGARWAIYGDALDPGSVEEAVPVVNVEPIFAYPGAH